MKMFPTPTQGDAKSACNVTAKRSNPNGKTPYRNDVDGCCPTHLDLFSGIGGFALAAQWAGFRTIGFCEIDKYCRGVLLKNFAGLNTFPTPIHKDIFDLDGRQFSGVFLITGGFPCQPFSVAGKRRGAADDRAIWPEMFRVINEARPAWVLGENVPGIIPMELDNVLSDLESIGYATRSFVIPACAVDARHRRDRLWIVAKSTEREDRGVQQRRIQSYSRNGSNERTEATAWLPEPAVCELVNGVSDGLVRYAGRVATKVPNRVQKLKALGNSILPQVAYEILREIRKLI